MIIIIVGMPWSGVVDNTKPMMGQSLLMTCFACTPVPLLLGLSSRRTWLPGSSSAACLREMEAERHQPSDMHAEPAR